MCVCVYVISYVFVCYFVCVCGCFFVLFRVRLFVCHHVCSFVCVFLCYFECASVFFSRLVSCVCLRVVSCMCVYVYRKPSPLLGLPHSLAPLTHTGAVKGRCFASALWLVSLSINSNRRRIWCISALRSFTFSTIFSFWWNIHIFVFHVVKSIQRLIILYSLF